MNSNRYRNNESVQVFGAPEVYRVTSVRETTSNGNPSSYEYRLEPWFDSGNAIYPNAFKWLQEKNLEAVETYPTLWIGHKIGEKVITKVVLSNNYGWQYYLWESPGQELIIMSERDVLEYLDNRQ